MTALAAPPNVPLRDPGRMHQGWAELGLSAGAVGTLVGLGAAVAGMFSAGRHDYPNLHTTLDTGMFLLPVLLALLLWDLGSRMVQPFPRWLAISFAVTGILAFVHVAVSVEWTGVMAPIAAAAGSIRPATWPPSAHLLPIGVGTAVWCLARGRTRIPGYGLALLALGYGLLVLFYHVPRYTEAGWLGITRPSLILAPVMWALVGLACWRLRDRDRLLPRLAFMSGPMSLGHLSMLYSRAPHDTEAMVAHLGGIAGYLLLLLFLMHLAAVDMSARIRAEQELATLNRELEQRVLDRTERLDASNRDLEQALAAQRETENELRRSNEDLERFAYVASHDLQEPLRMVGSYLQLLARRYQGKLDSDADEFIGFALDGAARMRRLIEDLLEYSRVGTRGTALVPTDATAALTSALANLKLSISDSAGSVTYSTLPTVRADPGQLEHLFQNLISNAIKFHGAAPPQIEVAAARLDREWMFSVRDNGIGIEPKYFDRIFVIFQRLHDRDQYPGTGIGLAIAKKIVERHGGRIWVESEPGRGATFRFTLGDSREA